MRLFFEARAEIAPGIWQYDFKPEQPIDFIAGQYGDLYLNGISDPRGPFRTFSFTSLPTDPKLSFITKHFTKQSPYKQALQELRPGETTELRQVMGDMVLPKSLDVPLVYVAGGIGIASYASMLETLLDKKEKRSIFLFYQLRNQREQIFRELTAGYPLELKEICVSPSQLTAEQIKSSTPPDALIYLSGSQNFVENLQKQLEKSGTPRSQIVFDYYDGYTEFQI